jgi:hypothetical protein
MGIVLMTFFLICWTSGQSLRLADQMHPTPRHLTLQSQIKIQLKRGPLQGPVVVSFPVQRAWLG